MILGFTGCFLINRLHKTGAGLDLQKYGEQIFFPYKRFHLTPKKKVLNYLRKNTG